MLNEKIQFHLKDFTNKLQRKLYIDNTFYHRRRKLLENVIGQLPPGALVLVL